MGVRGIAKNEVGNRYGRLLVISRAGSINGKAAWSCTCDCGAIIKLTGDALRAGKTKSCGCYRRSGNYCVTHGHARTANKMVSRTYKSWQAMWERCSRSANISYKNYGLKGISICPRWKEFKLFLEDMGERPPGKSLDRRKNHLGYDKENCQWSDRTTQSRNRSICRQVNYLGETATIVEWCERLELPYARTYYRLVIKGQPVEIAFNPNTVRRYS